MDLVPHSKNKEESEDPYSRVDYRRLIAWPNRIRREAPFLRRVLDRVPQKNVVDLGCGTGEHSRFLADEGFRVIGIDSSDTMIERANEPPVPADVEFVFGNILNVDQVVEPGCGAAICLGNTLVHLTESRDLELAFESVARILAPSGVLVFQILNYERIRAQGIRYLPLNFREDDSGKEIVFLRLIEPLEGGRVRFCPSTLRYDPDADPPLEVVQSKIVELRGWTCDELLPRLETAGFDVEEVNGDMEGGAFEADASNDLVVVARKLG